MPEEQNSLPKLNDYLAVGIAEGFEESDASDERKLEAWQYLVNTGICWSLQGWFGRTAQSLINQGLIKRPETNKE
jgi:hypothetical protein